MSNSNDPPSFTSRKCRNAVFLCIYIPAAFARPSLKIAPQGIFPTCVAVGQSCHCSVNDRIRSQCIVIVVVLTNTNIYLPTGVKIWQNCTLNKCSCFNITAMHGGPSPVNLWKVSFFMNVLLLFLSFWRKNNIAENSRGKTRIFEFIKQKISVFILVFKSFINQAS